ncbi:MAG: ABC transporter substrate-binding protein [Paracoccaceae bacterium]
MKFLTRAAVLLAVLALAPQAQAADPAFDLSAAQPGRLHVAPNEKAIAALPKDGLVTPGVLTVAVAPGGHPLADYAEDNQTAIGADPDIASLVAESLGLKLQLVPVAWADWPLGLTSGKYDAVISNVGVTEQRKEKFDFSTYRQGLHGFFVGLDSSVQQIAGPKDIAGLKIIVGSGTNQERILLEWNRQNIAAGLAPTEFQYFDDDAQAFLAIASGRADVVVQPHAKLVYIASRDKQLRKVGTLSAGWPQRSDVGVTTRKGSGLAEPISIALNAIIADGIYARTLDRWHLGDETLPESRVNPPGLPKF